MERLEQVEEGWELQDRLLRMTVLNDNAPKIVLTNDEVGWYATYLPTPPRQDSAVIVLGGDPLDAVRKLSKALKNMEVEMDKRPLTFAEAEAYYRGCTTPPDQPQQEADLRERIAKWLFVDYSQVELGQNPDLWGEYEQLPESDKKSWRDKASSLMLAAGYHRCSKKDDGMIKRQQLEGMKHCPAQEGK